MDEDMLEDMEKHGFLVRINDYEVYVQDVKSEGKKLPYLWYRFDRKKT